MENLTAMELINSNETWENIVNYMDDDIRNNVHDKLSPCTNREFLLEYCKHDDKFEKLLLEFNIHLIDLSFPDMTLSEFIALDGLTLSYDELSEIEELEKVKWVENCGVSGNDINKTWWVVTLSNGIEIDVYT